VDRNEASRHEGFVQCLSEEAGLFAMIPQNDAPTYPTPILVAIRLRKHKDQLLLPADGCKCQYGTGARRKL
jgi:hypothetical protein